MKNWAGEVLKARGAEAKFRGNTHPNMFPENETREGLLPYQDRTEAGKVLADRLSRGRAAGDCLVMAIPRGGVPVAAEIARLLGADLDFILALRLAFPGCEELVLGAVASGITVRNTEVMGRDLVLRNQFTREKHRKRAELFLRDEAYRGDRPPTPVKGREVILVDDGLNTGATMGAALAAARHGGARWIVAAAPVGRREAVERLKKVADEVVCPAIPPYFSWVPAYYRDYPPVSDREVREFLKCGRSRELPSLGR